MTTFKRFFITERKSDQKPIADAFEKMKSILDKNSRLSSTKTKQNFIDFKEFVDLAGIVSTDEIASGLIVQMMFGRFKYNVIPDNILYSASRVDDGKIAMMCVDLFLQKEIIIPRDLLKKAASLDSDRFQPDQKFLIFACNELLDRKIDPEKIIKFIDQLKTDEDARTGVTYHYFPLIVKCFKKMKLPLPKYFEQLYKDKNTIEYYKTMIASYNNKIPKDAQETLANSKGFNPFWFVRAFRNIANSDTGSPKQAQVFVGNLLKVISLDANAAAEYAEILIEAKQDIPKSIINAISHGYESARYFMKLFIEADLPVPQEFKKWLTKSSDLNEKAEGFIINRKPVPLDLQKNLIKSEELGYRYAAALSAYNLDIPEILLNNEKVKTLIVKPKEYAESYNRDFDGFFYHTADYDGVTYTLDKSINKTDATEICVCSFDSVRLFRERFVIVGRGDLRMLFDFDCYSRPLSDGIHRVADYKKGHQLNIKMAQPTRKYQRTDSTGSHGQTGAKILTRGSETVSELYHDEGFIKPKDAEFFIISHPYMTRNSQEVVKILQKYPNLTWVDYKTFENKILKSEWSVAVGILESIYRKSDVLGSDESERVFDESRPSKIIDAALVED